jgi:hypothetical protein
MSGSMAMTVIEIIKDNQDNITHLTCMWGDSLENGNEVIKERVLPIEVLKPYKTRFQKIEEAAERVRNRPDTSTLFDAF